MGKMKEIFIKENYPNEDIDFDIEREYYIDHILAQERQYEEYERLKKDPEMNYNYPLTTKIEVNNGDERDKRRTTIEIDNEAQEPDFKDEALWL